MEIAQGAQALYARDPSAVAFGIELIEASGTRAVVTMTLRDEMCNGLAIGHGGMTFLLADSAMAFASNSGDDDAVATSAEIDWLAPVRSGQVMTATAAKAWSNGRSTIWDIDVEADGKVVALVRGRTKTVKRS